MAYIDDDYGQNTKDVCSYNEKSNTYSIVKFDF